MENVREILDALKSSLRSCSTENGTYDVFVIQAYILQIVDFD